LVSHGDKSLNKAPLNFMINIHGRDGGGGQHILNLVFEEKEKKCSTNREPLNAKKTIFLKEKRKH